MNFRPLPDEEECSLKIALIISCPIRETIWSSHCEIYFTFQSTSVRAFNFSRSNGTHFVWWIPQNFTKSALYAWLHNEVWICWTLSDQRTEYRNRGLDNSKALNFWNPSIFERRNLVQPGQRWREKQLPGVRKEQRLPLWRRTPQLDGATTEDGKSKIRWADIPEDGHELPGAPL